MVSGDPAALAGLAAACRAGGVRARVLPVDYASHGAPVGQLRAEILAALGPVAPRPARVPMISAMTGGYLAGPEAGAGYWYDSLRAPVEFDRAVRVLAGDGHRVFIEASPHPVLTAPVTEILQELAGGPGAPPAAVTGTLRRDDGGPARLLASLAAAHVHGAGVDWAAVLGGGERVELPTYAFQHERYWPRPRAAAGGDVRLAGLGAVGHPLLGAAVELAGGGLVLTGLVSARTVPWLADHAVGGTVLLPGTAFVELAAVAAYRAGCGQVAELTVEAPLALDGGRAVQLQVTVAADPGDGQRAVEVYARTAGAGQDVPWTRHARGLLAAAAVPAGAGLAAWPPAGAVPVDAAGLYEGLAAAGYGYGPSFRGLRAAWRHDGDILAEVALPREAAGEAGGYGLHPALLDAALHALGLPGTPGPPGGDTDGIRLPFAWAGVSLHAAGASVLRARLRRQGPDRWSLAAADAAGAPVVTVGSLVLRPVAAGQLAARDTWLDDALLAEEWVPVPAGAGPADGPWAVVGDGGGALAAALAAAGARALAYPGPGALAAAVRSGDPVPRVVLAPAAQDGAPDGAEAARAAAVRALAVIQQWLAAGELAGSRLVLATRGAVAAVPGDGAAGPGRRGGLGAGPVGGRGEPGAAGPVRPAARRAGRGCAAGRRRERRA